MPIEDGVMQNISITFKFGASYCAGDGAIVADCSGVLNKYHPGASSATGTCFGTISDPLGTRDFTLPWTGIKTSSDLPCGPDQINIVPKIDGSLTNLTWKVTTSCEGPLNGFICFKGGNKNLCANDISETPSDNSIGVAGLTSDFAVDFLLPDGVEEVQFLYCDSATLSLITPRTCDDGQKPQTKTITTSPSSEGGSGTPDSNAVFDMTDGCDDGQSTSIRFFDFENSWIWPSPDTFWIMEEQDKSYQIALPCFEGSQICYGANSERNDKYWGVALSGTGDCSECCRDCGGQPLSVKFTCQ